VRVLFVIVIADNFVRALLIFVLYAGLTSAMGLLYRVITQKVPPKELISRVDTNFASASAIAAAVGSLVGGYLGNALPNVDYVFFLQGGAYVVIGILLCFSPKIREMEV
jgi:MFS family permease